MLASRHSSGRSSTSPPLVEARTTLTANINYRSFIARRHRLTSSSRVQKTPPSPPLSVEVDSHTRELLSSSSADFAALPPPRINELPNRAKTRLILPPIHPYPTPQMVRVLSLASHLSPAVATAAARSTDSVVRSTTISLKSKTFEALAHSIQKALPLVEAAGPPRSRTSRVLPRGLTPGRHSLGDKNSRVKHRILPRLLYQDCPDCGSVNVVDRCKLAREAEVGAIRQTPLATACHSVR